MAPRSHLRFAARFRAAPLALLLALGCGRLGYHLQPAVDGRSADAAADSAPDAAADRPAEAPTDTPGGDLAPPDLAPSDLAPDLLAPDVGPDRAVDQTLADTGDGASAGPPEIEGTLYCLPEPDPADLIADFEAGTPTLVRVGARGGGSFTLVTTGEGEIAVSPPRPFPLCGSSRFMTFKGMAIPDGRYGHIQGRFVSGDQPSGWPNMLDARAFRGIRLSVRAARSMQIGLRIPDFPTVRSRPYDHFSAILNVTTAWRTFVVPFSALRQSGTGVFQPALDLQQLYAVELTALEARDFDLEIDGISFVR